MRASLFLHRSTLFAWLISYQPAVIFSHNKSAASNQLTILFSQNKPAPAVSHQPNEQAARALAQSHYAEFRYVNIWHTSAATFRLMRWTRTEGLRGLSQSRANAANLRSLASALTSHTRMVPDSSYELVVHFRVPLASPLWLSGLFSTYFDFL
jgi:hypothetical protein